MGARRFLSVFRQELRFQLTRPLFWVFVLLLALAAWGMSSGGVRIQAGDSNVGGEKSFITSQFAMAFILSILGGLFYTFFVAVAAGMSVIRDDETKVGEVLHSTPLTAREYVWGKFLGVLVTFAIVLLAQTLFHASFNHVVPNAKAVDFRGPFAWGNYLRPALFFVGPQLVFATGVFFALGERSRRPILVFSVPVVAIVFWVMFLLDWSPSWLDPRINRLLMWIEPSGFRWLNEVWLKVDRGVLLYNTGSIGFDAPYLISRLGFCLIGIGGVVLSARHFAQSLRGARVPGRQLTAATALIAEQSAPETGAATGAGTGAGSRTGSGSGRGAGTGTETEAEVRSRAGSSGAGSVLASILGQGSIRELGMVARPRGYLPNLWSVTRFELKNLRGQPGLYLFIPLIILQSVQNGFLRVGAFDTPLLMTSGTYAAGTMNSLTLMVCLLLLFYMVESLMREESTSSAPVVHATPVQNGALLFGKALANSIVGVLILVITFLAGAVILLVQREVAIEVRPFLILWGLVLVPTFLVWSSFVMAVQSTTRNRYTTYAIGLAVLILSGLLQVLGKMNWLSNWDLWSSVSWTDFGSVEPNGRALLLNRLFYLALTGLFVAIAVRLFPRRDADRARVLDRMQPRAAFLTVLRTSPFWAPALVLGIVLFGQVQASFQAKAARNEDRDYWRKNILTWLNAPQPFMAGADIDLTLDPDHATFEVHGNFALFHDREAPLDKFALTIGRHFEDVKWTLDGQPFEPEDRARLIVFPFDPPLAAGDTVRVGFSYRGQVPPGITKNGGGLGEFIQPCGVVLTSFSNSFLPTIGFDESKGDDPDKPMEAKVYPKDFYVGKTDPSFGSRRPYPVRTRITGPNRMEYHAVGVQVEETVADGNRTVVWESDSPVNFFNVVGGEWASWQGDRTEIFYHPKHDYNIEEMGSALNAARRYYSEWFYPYPWAELRLNEFPALASYAQGFPSNITFSESIGFLTRSTDKVKAAFLVTAHEAAHQWWGNLVLPGKGPGGNILSEGMAHFSTILLFDQVYGAGDRIEFCKRIEERYGDNRQVDSEKALVETDGSRPGDQTVTYDKGGWVFWMLHELMGPDSSLAGIQDFVHTYRESDDHPVLQDYVAALRVHAPEPDRFDEFVDQWFHGVVVPEFRFHDVERLADGDRWIVTGTVENKGTGIVDVEIAAERGERFPPGPGSGDKGGDGETTAVSPSAGSASGPDSEADAGSAGSADPAYQEARTTVRLEAGTTQAFRIECIFEPERVVADPDAKVLQLLRESAVATL